MRTFYQEDIEGMEKRFRANFINSISGFKSANLIGSSNEAGVLNLAVFSSVVHIGANPPLLGFILRPTHVERNTYNNILAKGYYTINAVSESQVAEAHKTSAKYPSEISEFDKTVFTPEINSYGVPCVHESPISVTCKLESDQLIELNQTRFIIGQVIEVKIDGEIGSDGFVDLSGLGIAAITGMDSYHKVSAGTRFSYSRPDQPIHIIS
ncbi:MAG: flavin reductase, partial [Bacteroidota bacterium]